MNLIIKAAVGIYIVSVLIFSSFSKANDFESIFPGNDIYTLATTTPESLVDLVKASKQPENELKTIIINNLIGEINSDGESLFFKSSDMKSFYRLNTDIIDKYSIEALPVDVIISGFYVSEITDPSFNGINFFNIEEVEFLN